ncbi:tetratricopeptide repeat protein [Paludisphaera mucosa]|uniref:Tetratricopeptide repeat protein n=1 Tax=Paludisphaera mucosa TaxID=3030827 RepID=A0ABT6FKQ6_9BACT|nr:tetratricopeptide repeat protein [Paludisphaera mucosa]MDG3008149.1 tetratricopeptide repeat protein [Paludisphaera mucosa]
MLARTRRLVRGTLAIAAALIVGPGALGEDARVGDLVVLRPGVAIEPEGVARAALAGEAVVYEVGRIDGDRLRLISERYHDPGWARIGDVLSLDDAVALHTEALRVDPRRVDALIDRARIWSTKGEHAKAMADVDAAVAIDPSKASDRVFIRARKGDLQATIDECEDLLRDDPDDAEILALRGSIHLARGDLDRASTDFDAAIRLDANHSNARFHRAQLRTKRGDDDGATADLDARIRLVPNDPRGYFLRGEIRRRRGDLPGALGDFDAAVRLAADAEAFVAREALFFRGLTRLRLRDHDGAIADFDRVSSLGGAWSPWARVGKVAALYAAGRAGTVAEARSAIVATSWEGGAPIYAATLGHLAAKKAGDPAAAKALLDEAVGRADRKRWPYPAIRFLLKKPIDTAEKRAEAKVVGNAPFIVPRFTPNGAFFDDLHGEQTLLQEAGDSMRGEAIAWIAIDHLADGRVQLAPAYLARLRSAREWGPIQIVALTMLEDLEASELAH